MLKAKFTSSFLIYPDLIQTSHLHKHPTDSKLVLWFLPQLHCLLHQSTLMYLLLAFSSSVVISCFSYFRADLFVSSGYSSNILYIFIFAVEESNQHYTILDCSSTAMHEKQLCTVCYQCADRAVILILFPVSAKQR